MNFCTFLVLLASIRSSHENPWIRHKRKHPRRYSTQNAPIESTTKIERPKGKKPESNLKLLKLIK